MKIEGFNPLAALKRKKKVDGAKEGDFSDALQSDEIDENQGDGSVKSSAGTTGVSSLMQLQEIRVPTYSKKAVLEYANGILTGLEDVQQGILSGVFDRATLKRIEDLADAIPEGQHPVHIEEVLKLIKQRAAVELAKLEMSDLKRTLR